MPPLKREKLHRTVFAAAGIYNIAWGAYSVIDPQWLFRYAKMQPMNYPEVFACLGMVIGLYGILYLQVARNLQDGWLVAAVGMLGKVLGPLGWIYLISTGKWPASTIVLCLTNDLIWWLPFSLYLIDARHTSK